MLSAGVMAQSVSSPRSSVDVAAPPVIAGDTWSALQADGVRINQSRRVDLSNSAGNPDRSDLHDLANRARAFYLSNSDHSKAAEARQLEVFTLIQLQEEGDEMVEDWLDQAVQDAVADQSVPERMRAKIAAARAFTKETGKATNRAQHFAAIKQVSRQLMKDYPRQPQAYEALLAMAQVSDDRQRLAYAQEVATSEAPTRLKRTAQLMLDRQGLVGQSIGAVLGDAGAKLLSEIPDGKPILLYSWATWGPGSIELGRMIQARRFNAIGICLNADIEAAKKAQHSANLGGEHVYDEKGPAGQFAEILKYSTAGQIYLVDKEGVLRDVRGGDDLERKLRDLDFQTPELKAPELSL